MLTTVRSATLALLLALLATGRAFAQDAPKCSCGSGNPPPVVPPGGGPGPGGDRGPNGPDGDHSWIALLPLGPLAAVIGHRGGAALLPGSREVTTPTVREMRASLAFRANVDSLSHGMRAPDTATPLPTVVALALTLGAAGGLLLRRRSA